MRLHDSSCLLQVVSSSSRCRRAVTDPFLLSFSPFRRVGFTRTEARLALRLCNSFVSPGTGNYLLFVVVYCREKIRLAFERSPRVLTSSPRSVSCVGEQAEKAVSSLLRRSKMGDFEEVNLLSEKSDFRRTWKKCARYQQAAIEENTVNVSNQHSPLPTLPLPSSICPLFSPLSRLSLSSLKHVSGTSNFKKHWDDSSSCLQVSSLARTTPADCSSKCQSLFSLYFSRQ